LESKTNIMKKSDSLLANDSKRRKLNGQFGLNSPFMPFSKIKSLMMKPTVAKQFSPKFNSPDSNATMEDTPEQ